MPRPPEYGDRVRFRVENEVVEGTVDGAPPSGLLTVRTDAGDRYWVGAGDVLVIEDESWVLHRGTPVAMGREFTTVVSGAMADRPTIEVEPIEQSSARANYWIGRWREACEQLAEVRAELARAEAVLVAADRTREAYEAMIEGRDIGRLPEWTQECPVNSPMGSCQPICGDPACKEIRDADR